MITDFNAFSGKARLIPRFNPSSSPQSPTAQLVRRMQQHDHDLSEREDDIPAKIGKDFYVDDFVSGSDSVDGAVQLCSGIFGVRRT